MDKTSSWNWQHLEQMATNAPQQFMAELGTLRDSAANPATNRKLKCLQAKALITMNEYQQAEELILKVLEEAIEANDHNVIAQSNIILSICYSKQELSAKERPTLEIALASAKQSRDNDLIADVLRHIAATFLNARDRTQTLAYLERAEKQLTQDSDPALRLKILIDTGTAYYRFQQYDKALLFIGSALELSVELNDVNNQLMLLNNLSTLYGLLDRFDEAEEVLKKGLAICDEYGIAYPRVQFLFGLGALHMKKKGFAEAVEFFLQCEAAGKAINLLRVEFLSDLHSNLAGCYRYLGKNDLAWERLELAEEVMNTAGTIAMKMELDMNKANFLSSIGKQAEARKLLKEVIKWTGKNKVYDLLIMAQLNLFETYRIEQNYPKAISSLLDLHGIHQEYHSFIMTEQSKEFNNKINSLMQDYQQVQEQYFTLKRDIRHSTTSDFVGQSKAFKQVLEAALLAAQHPTASVLILGESGTGKDVLARLIHYNSSRKGASLVSVNMASISPNLLESEFFGHKKGSFTGAISDTKGLFLEANMGTLFLDEISEMPFNLQAKLLRVLETRKLTPVGSSKEISFDTRVISSTNKDILKLIKDDLFRLDLYHRLNTIEIHIPPLRERPEDIELLVLHYAESLAREMKISIPKIDNSFIRALQEYRFPGNVRELKNVVERLLIMSKTKNWNAETLASLPSLNLPKSGVSSPNLKSQKENLEKQRLIDALEKCGGKQKEAARLLGMSESTLTRRIVAYRLEIYTRKGK